MNSERAESAVGLAILIILGIVVLSLIVGFIFSLGAATGSPQASVSISQEYEDRHDVYTVNVGVDSMSNAEQLRVVAPETVIELESAKESTRITGLEPGDIVSIVGATNKEERTIQTYTVVDTES